MICNRKPIVLSLTVAVLLAATIYFRHSWGSVNRSQRQRIVYPPVIPILVHTVDQDNGRAISGVEIEPICLGGTLYATNIYRTDMQGKAKVMVFEHFAALRTTAAGYETNTTAFLLTNAPLREVKVKLKKLKKTG